MKKIAVMVGVFILVIALGLTKSLQGTSPAPEWSFNATVIEACSCPMFCQCYFNTKPAAHHDHGSGDSVHFCRANLAFKVNKGHFGKTKLDGNLFWLADDLGPDFSKGQFDWSVLYFDKSLTTEQRAALKTIVGHMYPVKWNSAKTAEGTIDQWYFNNDEAVATLDGGKTAEVRLKRYPGMTKQPIVIHNLRYWGLPRNDGFILMPNEVQAYRVGPNAFEFKGTNGFMITVDMNSNDLPAKS
jgi:hypothetical protein